MFRRNDLVLEVCGNGVEHGSLDRGTNLIRCDHSRVTRDVDA